MRKKLPIYIGTSGWVYKSWHERFYPKGLKKEFLIFYGKHFNSVEINTSFYHLPKKSTFEKWRKETPDGFVCAVKMSRYITHIERLEKCKAAIDRFVTAALGLKKKFGIVLIQIPPLLAFKEKVLTAFLTDLQSIRKKKKLKARFAFEPRHHSWFGDGNLPIIRTLLQRFDVTPVFAHSSVFPNFDPDDEENFLTDSVYIRFHGPKEFAASEYGVKLLEPWAVRMKKWRAKGKTVYAYFNDDAHGYAIKDALILQKLTEAK